MSLKTRINLNNRSTRTINIWCGRNDSRYSGSTAAKSTSISGVNMYLILANQPLNSGCSTQAHKRKRYYGVKKSVMNLSSSSQKPLKFKPAILASSMKTSNTLVKIKTSISPLTNCEVRSVDMCSRISNVRLRRDR